MVVRVLILSTFLVLLLNAADPTGTIAGTILDPSGASVPNALVAVANTQTGLRREQRTSTDGQFIFPLLPIGTYEVSIEAGGFRRSIQTGVRVEADQSATLPITLQVGMPTESVQVQADAEMVETRSGALSQVISQQKVVGLPLDGRNAASLVLLAPGTVDLNAGNASGSGDTIQTATYPNAQSISTNGGRADTVNYNLDGGSNQDIYTNVNNPFPNPDAVEEFSVQTNSFSAEYGRGSGAIVNVVTKSGTNSLHGSAFEFFRNGSLNARNFFAANHDQLKRNQFGGSVGGPIIKNRLFLFGTYQGTQLRDISAGNSTTVLTASLRAGDASSISRQIVNPFTKEPYPNNQIPVSQFDPVSVRLLSQLPAASSPDGIIYYDRSLKDQENQAMGRIDYLVGRQRLYGRYFYSKYTRDPVFGQGNLIASARGLDDVNHSVSFNHTQNFTSNLLNSLVVSYSRLKGGILSGAPFSFPDIGVQIAQTTPPELVVEVSGYFSINTGHPGHFDRYSYQITDSIHWVKGPHEVAMGGDFLHTSLQLANTYRQNGSFRFQGTRYSGDPRTDFLLGFADRFIQGGGEYADRHGNLGSLFIQDNYRVSRSLVLNLGLRWDPFVPYSDSKGRAECFLPGLRSQRYPNAPTGYLYAGDPGCPAGGFLASWLNFAPRLGFSYNLGGRGKTVLRGGAGIFYQPPFMEALNNMSDSAPFSPQIQVFRVPFANPYTNINNPFPAQFAPRIPGPDVTFDLPLSLAVSYQHDWKPSRVINWNLTIEHQLRADLLLRATYAASKGTHLGYNTDVNAPLPSPDATADNEDDRRPYKQFLQVTQDVSGANSIYNSLQLGVEKRFSHGFTLTANYTHGRSIDWVSYLTDLDGINVINPYNTRAYRGVSDYNIPNRLVLNYLWQLPSPRSGFKRAVLGGWTTSAIWNWQSGFPLNITSGNDTSYSLPGLANDQAQFLSTPRYTDGSRGDRIAQWFTTDAFGQPAPNTFGNAGRNILIGPGTFNVDFAAHKSLPITERLNAQIRGEFFNVLNHPLLGNPDTNQSDTNFGRITSARSPRIVQLAVKFIF
ncbi:MAG: carboxypeptidase regulatory-like domain-containing protein [Bryobacteraceae bacterium]